MGSNINISLVYETLLASPGMNDHIKLDMRVSRKSLLLLAACVESQIKHTNTASADLQNYFGEETAQETEKLITACLAKAELTTLHNKLKSFQDPA